MQELGVSTQQLDKALEGVSRASRNTHTELVTMASATVLIDGLSSAVTQLHSAFSNLSAAYDVQMEAETKLHTVMEQRMFATIDEVQSIKDLAAAQQELGIIGDEVQLAGAQQLATFLTQTDVLAQLIPAMNNLVAQQRGYQASAGDAVSVANLMGKAMQGQTSALTRVGITFSKAQENMMKHGNESERAAMLAQIITDNVGEMNKALAATPTGQMKQLENNLGDVKEKLGGMIQGAMPFITTSNAVMLCVINTTKLAVTLKGLGAAFVRVTGLSRVFAAVQAACSAAVTTLGNVSKAAGTKLVAMGVSASTARAAVIGLNAAMGGIATGGLALLISGLTSLCTKTSEAKSKMKSLSDDSMWLWNERYDAPRRKSSGDLETDLQASLARLKKYRAAMKEYEKRTFSTKRRRDKDGRLLRSELERAQENLDSLTELYNNEYSKYRKLKAQLQQRNEEEAAAAEAAAKAAKDARKKTKTAPKAPVNPFAAPSTLHTAKQYTDTIAALKELQQTSDLSMYADLGKRIDLLERLLKAYQRGTPLSKEQLRVIDPVVREAIQKDSADDFFKSLRPKSTKKIKAEPMPKLSEKVKHDSLEDLTDAMGKIQLAWTAISSVSSGMDSITDAINGNGNAWKKLSGIVGGTLRIFQAVATVMGILNPLINTNNTLTATGTGIKIADTAATNTKANEEVKDAAAGALAANSSIPFAGIAIGLAAVAAIVAALTSLPKFAKGGLAFGPTLGIFGEYSGASNNPEVVAPLSRIKEFIQPQGGGVLTARISGRDIEVIVDRRKEFTSRI